MINGIAMKGEKIILFLLQKQHTATTLAYKNEALVCESIYLVNMNADIKNTMKQCAMCLDYQQTQTHEMTILCDIPCIPLGGG